MNNLKTTILLLSFMLCSELNFAQKIIFVSQSASGTNTGTSWQNAFKDLKKALNVAQYGDSIFVAKGKYVPSSVSDRNEAFVLRGGIRFFGGFAGFEKSPKQRDFTQNTPNTTILSGDIGIVGDSTDNSYNILRSENLDSTTVIDGFRFMHANSNGGDDLTPRYSNLVSGGGIYLYNKKGFRLKTTIANCQFISNSSLFNGPAIFSFSEQGALGYEYNMFNCFLQNNSTIGAMISGYYYGDNANIYNTMNIKNSIFKRPEKYTYYKVSTGQTLVFNTKSFSGCCIIDGINNDFEDYDFGLSFSSLSKSSFKNCKDVSMGKGNVDSCYFYRSQLTFGSIFKESGYIVKNSIFDYSNQQYTPFFVMGASYTNCVFRNYNVDIKGPEYIENSVFENYNTAGVNISSNVDSTVAAPVIRNCIIRNNSSNSLFNGSGLYQSPYVPSIYMVNNTFYNNVGVGKKNVIYTQKYNNIIFNFENNIFAKGEKNRIKIASGNASIKNCIFDGKKEDLIIEDTLYDSFSNTYQFFSGTSSISNTLFDTNIEFKSVKDNDFGLLPCSKAINAGKNISATLSSKTDFTNKPRVKYDVVDIGAYEYQDFGIQIYEVEPTACGSKIGIFTPLMKGNCSTIFNISWKNDKNETGTGVSNLGAGTYTFFIKDSNGCADTVKNIIIKDKGNISANVVVSNLNGLNVKNGSIVVKSVINGKAPYQFLWNTGATTQEIKDLDVGTYSLTITDANGCSYTKSFVVTKTSATEDDFSSLQLSFFPNPTQNDLSVSFDNPTYEPITIGILGINGALLVQQKFVATSSKFSETIDLSAFETGIYLVRIQAGNKITTEKVVKF